MSATRSVGKIVWGVLLLIIALILIGAAVFFATLEGTSDAGTGVCPSLVQSISGNETIIEKGAQFFGACKDYTSQVQGLTASTGIPGVVLLLIAFILFGTSRKKQRYAYPQAQQQPQQFQQPQQYQQQPPPQQGPPSGWYTAQGQSGWQRYWNGTAWTEDYRPHQ